MPANASEYIVTLAQFVMFNLNSSENEQKEDNYAESFFSDFFRFGICFILVTRLILIFFRYVFFRFFCFFQFCCFFSIFIDIFSKFFDFLGIFVVLVDFLNLIFCFIRYFSTFHSFFWFSRFSFFDFQCFFSFKQVFFLVMTLSFSSRILRKSEASWKI